MTPTEIITEVDRLLRSMPANNTFYKRIRIAITPQEEIELKNYVYQYEKQLLRQPVYYRRIRNVPIQVEANPENDELTMEYLRP